MKKILVVSDVHGDINTLNKILKKESNADLKVYCGDLQSKDFSHLKDFDYKVTGNADYRNNLPETEYFNFDGVSFMLTHGHIYGSWMNKINFDKLFYVGSEYNVSVIIHGHDHIKAIETKNKILRFNPGSTSQPRDTMNGTYGLILIEKGKIVKTKHKKI